MELKNQVCSLELAKKLKELGVKQESSFTWGIGGDKCEDEWTLLFSGDDGWSTRDFYFAFSVAELGILLDGFAYTIQLGWNPNLFECLPCHDVHINYPIYADTEADARAKMLIYLLENKLI